MRVCLTVQGEQPMSSATSEMFNGVPSAAPGGQRIGNCSRPGGPGWPGQCPGQHWPGVRAENGRKCAGLAPFGPPAFGADVRLFLNRELGSLMSMAASLVVVIGTSEQTCKQTLQEVR